MNKKKELNRIAREYFKKPYFELNIVKRRLIFDKVYSDKMTVTNCQ